MAEGVRKRFGETVTGETKNTATLNAKTRAVMFLIGDSISGGAIGETDVAVKTQDR